MAAKDAKKVTRPETNKASGSGKAKKATSRTATLPTATATNEKKVSARGATSHPSRKGADHGAGVATEKAPVTGAAGTSKQASDAPAVGPSSEPARTYATSAAPTGEGDPCEVSTADLGREAEAAPAQLPSGNAPCARDPRLPPVGTKLFKRDRQGRVCECEIIEGGFRYGGHVYPSLSAAAKAAAKDLGIATTVNGYVFFNLAKVSWRAKSPGEDLQAAAERFEERAAKLIGQGHTPEARAEARRALEAHMAIIADLINRAA